MLATDFFTVETAWLHRLHVLFFIQLKVHLGGITASPTGEWVAQQAWNRAWKVQDGAGEGAAERPPAIPFKQSDVLCRLVWTKSDASKPRRVF